MSALGQKRTSGHTQSMSASPPKADIDRAGRDVRFVPLATKVQLANKKGRPAAALLSGSDQFVRSRGGIPLRFVDSEALRRSEHPGEVLRPVNVDGSGSHAGGPGGMLRILQFRWQRANKLVIRRFR